MSAYLQTSSRRNNERSGSQENPLCMYIVSSRDLPNKEGGKQSKHGAGGAGSGDLSYWSHDDSSHHYRKGQARVVGCDPENATEI